jgi:Tol biopolymer transport system component
VRRLILVPLAALLLAGSAGAGATARTSRIAFALEVGGPGGDLTALFTVRPDGTHLRRLTAPPTRQALGGDSGPVWSPRGNRLVFERNLPYWGSDRVRLMSVDARGGAVRALTGGPFDAMPSISPDGDGSPSPA